MNEKENQFNKAFFDRIRDKIAHNQNDRFNCRLEKEEEDKNLGVKFVYIISKEKVYNQFIREIDDKNLENKDIIFSIEDIRIEIIKCISYFKLTKYKIFSNPNKSQIDEGTKIFNSINEVDEKYDGLCCFKLRAKEVFGNFI